MDLQTKEWWGMLFRFYIRYLVASNDISFEEDKNS